MRRNHYIGAILLTTIVALWAASSLLRERAVVEAAGTQAPRFEVDPLWPKPLPNHWVMGSVIGLSVDSNDHVWIIHRQGSLERMETYATATPKAAECCAPAPPVLEFNEDGDLIGHWGGPGAGYDWPVSNHGITVDYKGNVWIGGNGRTAPAPAAGGAGPGAAAAARTGAESGVDESLMGAAGAVNDSFLLKFTQDGKFLMQIGKPGQSRGSNDTQNLRLPAKTIVDPKTNELYVADGYGNHRVIVFDADSGKYKRHWGAYGHKPDDANPGPYNPQAPPAQQFRNPVHCAMLANDGLLYVCDRTSDRIQIFRTDGTFVKEVFVEKETLGDGTAFDIAFSKDPGQKYLYLADGSNMKIHIFQRDTMQELTTFGDGGRQPGQFYAVHSIDVDSKGNLFTTETYRGQRVQKFRYKGVAAVTRKDQGVVWPK
jgi:DNA-binding beta-propeller fold protein YncE